MCLKSKTITVLYIIIYTIQPENCKVGPKTKQHCDVKYKNKHTLTQNSKMTKNNNKVNTRAKTHT